MSKLSYATSGYEITIHRYMIKLIMPGIYADSVNHPDLSKSCHLFIFRTIKLYDANIDSKNKITPPILAISIDGNMRDVGSGAVGVIEAVRDAQKVKKAKQIPIPTIINITIKAICAKKNFCLFMRPFAEKNSCPNVSSFIFFFLICLFN